MTELLQKAFEEASKLPPDEQDAIASVLLAELADEEKWDATLASTKSQQLLRTLAERARQEYQSGATEKLDPDSL